MKVTTERTPNCTAIVTVELDPEQVQGAMKTAAAQISRVRPIPGFRPGKAPYERVERVVGKDLLRDQAIEDLAQSVYKQVLKEQDIDPYDAGKLDVVQKDPVIFKFTIPTRPVVTLGDYRSIHLEPHPVEVSDEEISRVVQSIQMEQATMNPVTRPAQEGDLVTITVKGGIEGQPPMDREGMQVRIEKSKPVFPWLEQLIGMNADESRDVVYSYPSDEAEPGGIGKTATYSVKVTDIKEPSLPELNDEFAKSVSSFETLEQLKGRIRVNLQSDKQAEEDNRYSDQVLDAVVEQSQIAYPDSMLEDETQSEIARSKDVAKRLGLTWDKYLQLAGKSESDYMTEMRPQAEKRLKRLLVMLQVIDAETIQVSSKEVDVEIDSRAQADARQGGRADQTRRALSTPDSRHDIEFNLKIRKAMQFLIATAKGEPTSGKILTPEIVRQEEAARQLAAAKAATPPPPSGLITDPSQVNSANWPQGLDRPIVPGRDQ